MELSEYDEEFVPGLFSLVNNGKNLCYVNALIQSLVSLPSINQYLMNRKEDFVKEKNSTALTLLDLLENNPQPEKGEKFSKIRSDNAIKILRALVSERREREEKARKNNPNIRAGNLVIGEQEDPHEGLTFLLDAIGNSIDAHFHVRYTSEICCRQCKHRRKTGPEDQEDYLEPPEIFVDLSEDNPNIGSELNTKEEIENYIKRNVQIPEGYRCEKCKKANDIDPVTKKMAHVVYQGYSLARLSEVIILLFKRNRYGRKDQKVRFFPQELDFTSRSGNLHYKVVAQIEHVGGTDGGHYTARCRRIKPPGWNEFRKEKAKKLLEAEDIRLEAARNLTERESIRGKIKELNDALAYDELTKDRSDAVYIFNDRDVKYCTAGFEPTPNTYMVFYHLFPNSGTK
jgi:ubiquitin C-terminal hydrolase